MAGAPTVFFDIGGVLLTNAWDTGARKRAVETFGLDWPEFQTRHEMLKTAIETGRISLDVYIRKTAFHCPRSFTPEDFRAFMYEQSKVLDGGAGLEFVRALAATGRYRLFALNNESRELHEYRVKKFDLGSLFQGFLTSCYLGQVKPDEAIYLNAMGIAGPGTEHVVFIDDRPLNVEPAIALGLDAVLYQGVDSLRAALAERGIVV